MLRMEIQGSHPVSPRETVFRALAGPPNHSSLIFTITTTISGETAEILKFLSIG
jgi:hypothetical protein